MRRAEDLLSYDSQEFLQITQACGNSPFMRRANRSVNLMFMVSKKGMDVALVQ